MDKVQKIRKEVVRLKSNLIHGACASQIAMETRCKEEAYDEVISLLDSMQEEPVSDELDEAADNALNNVLNAHEIVNIRSCLEMFKYGAQWKEKEMQSTIELAEDHAMLAGMEKMKEQLMKDAIDAVVHIDAGNYPYIPEIALYDYDKNEPLAKEGEKYKVVLIKKD